MTFAAQWRWSASSPVGLFIQVEIGWVLREQLLGRETVGHVADVCRNPRCAFFAERGSNESAV